MNRYSKALKQLKSTKIDSKIKKLEESPTNNTKGVYSLNPQGYRLGKPEPPTQFFPKDDGTYPDGVPGTDGEAVYTRPGGFWDGGKNWESTMSYDAGQDGIGDDGKNTDGLIDADGTVKTFLPDGSRGFVLGPLTDGFVLDHGDDAYTNIGYLQKDTRQFVLLAKIHGQWKSGFYSDHGDVPVWGGTATGFTAHNENFTLAMAQWMRTQILADKYYSNLPYFYSGGVPQQGIDDCPTCPVGMKGGTLVGGGGDGSSLSGDGSGTGQTGTGSGDDVTTGDQYTQDDPNHGDSEDAKLWGMFKDKLGDLADIFKGLSSHDDIADALKALFPDGPIQGAQDLIDSLKDELSKESGINWQDLPDEDTSDLSAWRQQGLEVGDAIERGVKDGVDTSVQAMKWTAKVVLDSIKALSEPTGESLNKFAQLMSTSGGVMTGFAVALAADTKGPIKKALMGGESETWARGGDHPIMNNSNNEAAYGINLAMSLSKSQASGKMVMMDNGNVDPNVVGNKISKADIDLMFKTNNISSKGDLQNGRPTVSTSADQVLNPGGTKQAYMGLGFGNEGGSIMQPYIAKDGTIKILNTADKTLRIGGESGEGFDIKTQTFTDIPSVDGKVSKAVQSAVESGQFAKGIAASLANTGASEQSIKDTTNEVLNSPVYKGIIATLDSPAGDYLSGKGKGFTNSAAAGSVLYSKVKQVLGFQKTTELEKKGGHGHVRRQNVISLDNLKPEVKEYLLQKMGKTDVKESIGLRKVKFVMNEIADAPVSAAPTNTQTTSQPTTQKTQSKQTADAVAKEYLEKNGPKKTQELLDKTKKVKDELAQGGKFPKDDGTGRGSNRGRWGSDGPITTDSEFGKKMLDAIRGMGNLQAKLGDYVEPNTNYVKNVPSWFWWGGFGKPTWSWYEGKPVVWGTNYSGGRGYITPGGGSGDPGTAGSGYGTKGYDMKTNSGGTSWEFVLHTPKAKPETSPFPKEPEVALGAKPGDELAWGKPKEPPSPENKQPRGMDMNIINYYNSGNCCFPIPDGWTNDDVYKYIQNRDKGFPNQSSSIKKSGTSIASTTGASATDAAILAGRRKKKTGLAASYQPVGKKLQESDLNLTKRQRKLIREVRNEYKVPELPKKYKMNFKGKFTPQNTPDKTASKESDGLAATANMRGQKWSQDDKYWAGYETTETMNVIYDKVGHGEQAWNRMIEGARQKNGWRNREIIEQLNIIAHEKASRKVNPDYQSPWVIQEASPEQIEKEKNFDKVNKIKQIVGDTKRGDIQPEYPDQPAPELAPNGYHPNYGKKYKHDKLDPHSAEAMPDTGNPEIDANIRKATDHKKKARKLKNLLGKMRR